MPPPRLDDAPRLGELEINELVGDGLESGEQGWIVQNHTMIR